MNETERPVGEDDLTAYVDGELASERRAVVEVWLREHPQAAARVEADLAVNARLKEALAPLAKVSLPARFRVDNVERAMRARRLATFRRMAAALVLLLVGGAGGWALNEQFSTPGEESRMLADAVTAHRLFVTEKRHPVEVSADAKDHLGAWLGHRIGRPVEIPDLSAQGLVLVGGRLLPSREGPSGQIMYQDANGRRVTLFLAAGSGDQTAFAFRASGDAQALAWRSPELAYVLTGPFSRNRLVEIAHVIHRAAND